MDIETIKQMIEQGLPDADVAVDGDGTHFQAKITSAEFIGKSKLEQHRLVYKIFGDKVGTDIHALSLSTHTPEQ